jgi:carbonic anhydrase/acetyltransferase-like protein (isoleucine patch superfamily)
MTNKNILIPDNTILETSYELSDSEIESVNFGRNIEISGNYVFARSQQIRELDIPSGTIFSGYGIFYYSNGLQNLTIGDNVTLSGSYIFQNCLNLESIVIGHSTIISGNSCFSCLSGLQILQFAPNTTFSGYYLFADCDIIREVIIPDNCVISGDFFFKKCCRLERIVIGNNVVIQGSHCFRDCCGIKSITIGNNVTISGLKFLEDCFVNQNVEMIIGSGYIGYPIHIPIPILPIEKFSDAKEKLRYKTNKCAISLEKFKDNSDVIILRCGHIFLLEPLQQWLEIKKFCPTCRQNI